VGKLLEYPDIMTQGKTLKELEENMKEAYMLMTMEDVPEEHKAHPRNMKRKDLIKQITSIGCVLVRHGQRHDLYPVRNNAPLLPPGQRPSLRGRSPSWAEPGPVAAVGLHFK
jgi:predicted RNase H-like HicB family nuclease